MNLASWQMRTIAHRLVASDLSECASVDLTSHRFFRATDKLRLHLSTLMGRGGVQALLTRALLRATAEVPWLTGVRVVAGGDLEGLTAAHETCSPQDFSEGEVVLLAQLLGLLVAFIGPALTVRLINQLWPQLAFTETDFSHSANNEKAH